MEEGSLEEELRPAEGRTQDSRGELAAGQCWTTQAGCCWAAGCGDGSDPCRAAGHAGPWPEEDPEARQEACSDAVGGESAVGLGCLHRTVGLALKAAGGASNS